MISSATYIDLENFISAYLQQTARKIMLYFVNNLHEKRITEIQDG